MKKGKLLCQTKIPVKLRLNHNIPYCSGIIVLISLILSLIIFDLSIYQKGIYLFAIFFIPLVLNDLRPDLVPIKIYKNGLKLPFAHIHHIFLHRQFIQFNTITQIIINYKIPVSLKEFLENENLYPSDENELQNTIFENRILERIGRKKLKISEEEYVKKFAIFGDIIVKTTNVKTFKIMDKGKYELLEFIKLMRELHPEIEIEETEEIPIIRD